MCGCFFLEAGLRDDAEIVTEHQQCKQRHGQSYAHGQCLDGAFGFSFVADQIIQRRSEAQENEDEKCDDDVAQSKKSNMSSALQCKG